MNPNATVSFQIPKAYIDLVNQIFEIDKKTSNLIEENSIKRNINRINTILNEGLFGSDRIGLSYHNPIGEKYSETRTDCQATISGDSFDDLEIVEVVKPIIFCLVKNGEITKRTILQPAVVIVKSKN